MGLHKALDTNLSDSVKASYHRIMGFYFDAKTGLTDVTVFSFISEQDEEAGKAPYSQSTYKLATVNPMELIVQSDVGLPVMAKIQAMLEPAIVAEVPEFSDAVIS